MGCYVDGEIRDLPFSKIESSKMTLDMCAINCEINGSYSYFGTQVG